MESMLLNDAELNSEVSNLSVARDVLSSSPKHVKDGYNTGSTKLKPKWTKIIQMDCGLGFSNKDEHKEVLGKKGSFAGS